MASVHWLHWALPWGCSGKCPLCWGSARNGKRLIY
jgi:hypothetical protein